jgi:hypothetical protein
MTASEPWPESDREIVSMRELTVRTRAIALLPQALRVFEGVEAEWTQRLGRLAQGITVPLS